MQPRAPYQRPLAPMIAVIGFAVIVAISIIFKTPTRTTATPTTLPTTQQTTTIPARYFFAAVILLPILIMAKIRRYRARYRPVTGRCLTCGRELHAFVDQCPECGSTFIEQFP